MSQSMIQLDLELPAGAALARRDQYVLFRQLLGGARRLLPLGRRAEQINSPRTAEYSYSVWLRHMALASQFGPHDLPRRTVVELGPGGSLGVGLAALLHGADTYFALDSVRHADAGHQDAILDELVRLFQRRAPIPSAEKYPHLKPFPLDYRYPCAAGATDLSEERVAAIRAALAHVDSGTPPAPDEAPSLRYFTDLARLEAAVGHGGADLVLSQAVMEYLPDLDAAYADQRRWLGKGGWISHQIDLSAHETAASWNGHWAVPAPLWEALRRTRPSLINRRTYGQHLAAMRRQGFEVLMAVRNLDKGGIDRSRLAAQFRGLDDEDLQVRGAWIMARAI